MRPKTIVYFEWIIFGTSLLAVPQSFLVEGRTKADSIVVGLITLAVPAAALLASRRRSKNAMSVLTAVYFLSLPMFAEQVMTGPLFGSQIIAGVQLIGQGVALALLFTRPGRRWMRREDEQQLREDEKLRNVFD